MSNDLISRKALEKSIRAYADKVGCERGEYELANGILKSLSIIENAPTAYDVDRVVENLEKEVRCVMDTYCGSLPDDAFNDLETLEQETIKAIVKEGGV